MRSPLLRFAVWLVRAWTRFYTWSMEPSNRDARRGEIESDLWESTHEEAPSDAAIAREILARLFAGVADDVRWRIEQPSRDARLQVTAAVAAVGILAAGVWLFATTRPGTLPTAPPPPAPTARGVGLLPPPPPPPPPPLSAAQRPPRDWPTSRGFETAPK